MKQHRSNRGFTLIEILLVVTIIGILIGLILPQLSGRSEQARATAAGADIKANIPLALEMYELDNRQFPTTEQGLDALRTKPSTQPAPPDWRGPYLKKQAVDPWSNPYQYKAPGTHNEKTYDLFSKGPDKTEGTEDDIKNWD